MRHFSQRVIHEFDARLIRINPREHMVPRALDVGLAMGALHGLQAIEDVLEQGSIYNSGAVT